MLMMGNEALAKGAIAAGCRFYAGYPITPASEVMEYLAREMPRVDGVFIQMEDEIASIAAVIGASVAGVKAMTATSGPGFSLMQENLGLAVMTETPCVVVNSMRGGPSTGQPTRPSQGDVMQARWGTHGDHSIIAFAPSSVSEMFYHTVEAFNLSEKYRTPVLVLADALVSHLREPFTPPDDVEVLERPRGRCISLPNGEIPAMDTFGEGYRRHITGLVHDHTGFPTTDQGSQDRLLRRLNGKIEDNLEDICRVDRYHLDDADVAVLAYGPVARSAHRAVRMAREEGVKAGLLALKTVWPYPQHLMSELEGMGLVVAEMNLGMLSQEVRAATNNDRVVQVNRVDGQLIEPEEILEGIREANR